ncbi:MAG: apolipoprotein N-acyltransferase [Desulfobacterales bacterium]
MTEDDRHAREAYRQTGKTIPGQYEGGNHHDHIPPTGWAHGRTGSMVAKEEEMLKTITVRKMGLAIASGLMLTGSFPAANLSSLSWFALVPLFIAMRDLSAKDSFRIGLLTGCIHYLSLMYWLAYTMQTYGGLPPWVSIPVLFLLAIYLGLYLAAFSAASSRFLTTPLRLLVFGPLLWVSVEYLRSFLFTGLPWCLLGYCQHNNLHLIQISDIFGVYGVSYVIVFANVVGFLAIQHIVGREWQFKAVNRWLVGGGIISLAFLTGMAWGYGRWRIDAMDRQIAEAPTKRISIVQGNIDQAKKWDLEFRTATTEIYADLSQSAKPERPDLVVWPETATPFYYGNDPRLTRRVRKAIGRVGTDFLIGSPSFLRKKEDVTYYNSAYLIDGYGRTTGKYDKAHLVPFGEYVPFKKWLPFLGKIVAHVGDFTAGEKGKTLLWGDVRLGVQICYEIIFPNLSAAMVLNQASYIVNITNDAWYGKTSAPYQHFAIARFRAIENRRSLIRAANTGISGFVDPVGRIIGASDIFQEAVLTQAMPIINEETVYTRWGDVFAQICLMITLLLFLRETVARATSKKRTGGKS